MSTLNVNSNDLSTVLRAAQGKAAQFCMAECVVKAAVKHFIETNENKRLDHTDCPFTLITVAITKFQRLDGNYHVLNRKLADVVGESIESCLSCWSSLPAHRQAQLATAMRAIIQGLTTFDDLLVHDSYEAGNVRRWGQMADAVTENLAHKG